MGWNTWNKFGCNISEETIKSAADRIVDLGLDKLGYKYVNIDDCWNLANRDPEGHQQADPDRFPNGMKAVGDYIHGKGLLYGIYSSAGTKTCEERAGSLNYEIIDAMDFASWGVDFLKYDNCFNENIAGQIRYPKMRDALNMTGRPIFYSICNWGEDDITLWGNVTGNSWRTTGDISDYFEAVMYNFYWNAEDPQSAGPGGWNDPDMLEIGNGGLTEVEEKTHFALWAIVKAPLIIGCDLNKISSSSLAILTNKRLININ